MVNGQKHNFIQIPVKRKNFQLLGNSRVQKAIYIKMSAHIPQNIFDDPKMLLHYNHLWFDVKWVKVYFMSNIRHLF